MVTAKSILMLEFTSFIQVFDFFRSFPMNEGRVNNVHLLCLVIRSLALTSINFDLDFDFDFICQMLIKDIQFPEKIHSLKKSLS